MNEQQLVDKKRADAMLRITRTALGTGLASTVPTPALELTKELGIAVADAWMFYDLYSLYYEDELNAQHLRDLLGTAGIIVFSGGVVSYAALKIGQGLLGEFLNLIPVGGWIVSGLITGSTTFTIGVAWMIFLEDTYRQRLNLPRRVAIENGVVEIAVKAARSVPVAAGIIDDGPTEEDFEATEDMEVYPEGKGTLPTADAPITEDALAEAEEDAIEMITTAHPEGKPGQTIPKANYDMIRSAVIDMLRGRESVPFQEMVDVIEDHVTGLDKSARWYVTTVKLDLEAHGVIERVPDVSPQELRLIDAS